MDKKKTEVYKRRRYLGKRDNTMDKRFYRKLLLLSCLVLAILPSFAYADYYAMLKVETYPVVGSTDVTTEVPFQIRVIACNENGDQVTLDTLGWNYAKMADIILYSNDPNAQIKNDWGVWVPLPGSGYETQLDGDGDMIFEVILNTVGDDKRITVEQNPAYLSGIFGDFLDFKVHDFVDHFVISVPVAEQTAGVSFNITIYARDANNNIAETFSDDVDIRAVIPPLDTYEPDMTPSTIAGSSFTNGVATILVTIYGSHPVSRLVKIKCENTVEHGGSYAQGESPDFIVNPNSYAKILLLVPGEELRYGKLAATGKGGMPLPQTAGVLINSPRVKVYTIDEYWNPVFDNVPINFTSSDPLATFVGPPIMTVNPQSFDVTFYTADPEHWIRITEGTKESVSTDIRVDPNTAAYFEFDEPIGSTQYTTDPFEIKVTAYDVSNNVATGYNASVQGTCSMGDQYITPNTIQFSGGRATAWVRITMRGNGVTVTVTDGTNSVESNSFNVFAGDFTKLLVLLEGETQTAGLGDGKGGFPDPINAGESTTVTIIATDDYWNRINTSVQINDISSLTGHIDPPPLPFNLGLNGIGQCQVTFRTARTSSGVDEPQIITVSGGGTPGMSSPIQVSPGPYDRLVLVAPGEQLDPGTFALNGKTDDPATTQTAGVAFNLTVAATDEYWNPIDSGFPDFIYFSSGDDDPDVRFAGSLPGKDVPMDNGIEKFPDNKLITLASPQWVRVRGWTAATGEKLGQANIPVTHGPLDHFAFSQIPNTTAGNPINITITAQDQYDNTVENGLPNGISISLNSSKEPFGQQTFLPRVTEPFNNGQSIFTLEVYKADTNITLSLSYGFSSGVSNPFNVIPGPYAKLILLLDPPDQMHEPGNILTQGKSGIPDAYTVGDPPVQTTVYAVDEYWNKVDPPSPEPQVEITSQHYLEVGPTNSQTMSNGEVTFWTAFQTATTGQVLVVRDMDTGYSNSSTINVYPGTFTKLQIIAPGEVPDPGSNPDGSGKTGTPLPQVTGVGFDLTVRAVDQYWNLVPYNGESIDLISQTDTGLDNRYEPKPFEAGVANFNIWLDGNNEDIDVIAISLLPPPDVEQDKVWIHVDRGYKYVVKVPTYCTASNNLSQNTFTMTVRLVDENEDVVTSANNEFQMTPWLATDYSQATNPEGLGVNKFQLTSGEATFAQSYDIVEVISIAVSDDFERGPVYSSAIDVRETALKYRVNVPAQATVGEEFEMTISLIDTGTGNVVPTRDKEVEEVNLVPVSSAETGREGRLRINRGQLSKGEWKITNQWYTKAEWIRVEASDGESYAEADSSIPFEFLPGELKRLQILAPGEISRPGEMDYIGTGKESSNILVQDTEIGFPVIVRAVDKYWNLVDLDGGSVYLSSESSFSSQPELSFDNGMATFIVTIHEAGASFTLKAEAKQPTGLQPQSVTIPMEEIEYRIESDRYSARTVDSLLLTIKLVDETGWPKSGANNSFILTPCTHDFKKAPGQLTEIEGPSTLSNGYAQVLVNYNTVGKIRIMVSDNFGRAPAYTDPIDIQPVGLRYEVKAPEKVEAGKEFSLTVRLIDTGREEPVTPKEYDSYRYVKLVAYSSPDGNLAEGELKIKSLYLEGGEKTVLQSYNLAHEIYIEASDAKTYDHPVTSEPPDRSGVIEVFGAPKTVMKLEGAYNEMDGALYLRSSTLISIMCTSDIKAEYIYCRDNKGDWKRYDKYVEPFALSPGAHIIEYYGEDKYGHKEEINRSKTIYVSFFSAGAEGVLNRPNPFRAGRQNTLIEYNLEEPSNVTITIYDLFGQEVWRKSYRAGENGGVEANSVPWDGRNLSGEVVGNGGYICRIWVEREKRHMVRKIAVAK